MNIHSMSFSVQEVNKSTTIEGQLLTIDGGSLRSCIPNAGSNNTKSMTLLPADFQPSSYSVFCGRGKGYYNACGNRRLRVTVMTYMPQYLDAEGTPTERSRIISRVKNIIKECCPVGAFIKYENGRYYELSDKAAREKCSALFRDCVQAQAKGKQAKKAKKQVKESLHAALEYTNLLQNAGKTSRRPSIESDSSGDSSMGSFYDVDTEQHVSLDTSENAEAKMTVTLNGINEFLGYI